MSDPYAVLGLKSSATDEEIKSAYRSLAKKYHPDTFQDNALADLAEEKMKQINEAHDLILKMRKEGQNFQYNNPSYQQGRQQNPRYHQQNPFGGQGGDPVYQQIRAAIALGDVDLATLMLDQIANRDAEWYFLLGSVAYRQGWLDDARQGFETACHMDPLNQEYRQALQMLLQRSQRPQDAGNPTGCCCCPCECCDCCTTLCCLNFCCPCC